MTDIATAIKSINSEAEFICRNEDINDIEWVNGTTPISKIDIENKIAELEQQKQQAIIDAENNKASAKQKLQDLGLTVEEIKDTFGL